MTGGSAPTSAARSPTFCCSSPDGRVRASRRCSRRRPTTTARSSTPCASSPGRTRRGGRPRDDGRDERRARAPRRAYRARDDRGLPRRARAAADAHAAPLRLLLDEAAVARAAARPAARDRRARGRLRRGAEAARRARGARARRAARASSALESVAVCLLHAHVYPGARARLGEILRAELPGRPGVALERDPARAAGVRAHRDDRRQRLRAAADGAATSAACASGLDAAGVAAPLTIMQSSGGADERRRRGAAARVRARVGAGRRRRGGRSRSPRALGLANVITFDMGGTTAKASLIEDGAVSRSQEYEVGAALSAGSRLLRGSGELIRIPTLDIAEVGAGGGSIAWVDPAGGAARRAPERRRLAGARLLRARRRGADGDRRERRARLHPCGQARLRRSHRLAGARRGGGRAGRRGRRPLGARRCARHPRARERRHDAGASRRHHRARP